jgi:hypothetical protein
MSNDKPKKRCNNCKKILVNGIVIAGVTQIRCDCGHNNIITGNATGSVNKKKVSLSVG